MYKCQKIKHSDQYSIHCSSCSERLSKQTLYQDLHSHRVKVGNASQLKYSIFCNLENLFRSVFMEAMHSALSAGPSILRADASVEGRWDME